ncbi:hypothetical protein OHC33_002930 [Knufia fluminis]|uniref:F-box protein n=1 Tax=Knufia fluminis TaxID=191047 RepID=A0AAN8F499_9EURO|nr:hypothetical protein OHC33_002930 [Knufia fluminis]
MAAIQPASPSLLGLPAEIRLMILKAVFSDVRYYHSDDDHKKPTRHARQAFEDLKSNISLIWVNKLLRNDSIPLLKQSLEVYVVWDIKLVDFLIQEYATTLTTTDHVINFGEESQRSPNQTWVPEDYFKLVKGKFRSLRHIRYETQGEDSGTYDINDMISSFRGESDDSYIEDYFSHDGLECEAPTAGQEPFTFTADIVIEYNFIHGSKTWFNRIFELYRFEVNAFNRQVEKRYINLEPSEMKEHNWVPTSECCVMVEHISWPAVYHMPTGQITVLLNQREMGSDDFADDEVERAERNDLARQVVAELMNAETLKKALEEAYSLI